MDPYAGPYSPSTYLWTTNPPSYYRGTETAGIFRWSPLEWRLTNSHSNPVTNHHFSYGLAGDKAVYGDWNNDGKGNIGAFRKVNANDGRWYINYNFDGSSDVPPFVYGLFTDTPVAGNWLGAGARPGVYRAEGSNGRWYINYGFDGSSEHTFIYGLATDLPVTGDWNCNGIETVGVFRNGTWYLNNDLNGSSSYPPVAYGQSGDIPVAGDWNGDGCDGIGVYRNGTWYLDNERNGASSYPPFSYGVSTDLPVVGDWDGQ